MKENSLLSILLKHILTNVRLAGHIMIFILQIILLALGLLLDNAYAKFIPLSLPIIYIFIIGPGAFTGTRDINEDKLKAILSKNWENANELAKYIKKYWVALEYVASSRSRMNNCVTLSFASFGLSPWYYLKDYTFPAFFGFTCGIVLYVMATRVNRPQSIYCDRAIRQKLSSHYSSGFYDRNIILAEWSMAAASIVAFAELFPGNKNFSYRSDEVLSDEFARDIVNNHRINKL